MSREDVLLKEYEVCQQEMNPTASNYWTTVQIFIGVSTAFLAALSFVLATQDLDVWGLVLTVAFSLTVIAILILLHIWLGRVAHLIGMNNRRQREIEVQLGMRKNIFVWGLDHWDKIPQNFRRKIAETWEIDEKDKDGICKSTDVGKIPKKYRPPEVGRKIIGRFLIVMAVPWVIIIVIAILKFALVN